MSQLPLSGVTVVDLTSVVFGPFATSMLVDLGADVIKVEAQGGDTFRFAGKAARTPGMGACHMNLNRGKRSVVLDLKSAEGADALRGLLGAADVFIHNIRQKAISRLGFGYDDVRSINPGIVYAHCVGFGSEGPYADLQAYDDVIQAAAGATTLLPRVDGDERPRYLPSTIADKVAGMYGAYGVLAALMHRLRTGEGQHVEVPMFEAFTRFMLAEHLYGQTFDPPTTKVGYQRQLDPHRQPFPTADGYISIVPYTDDSIRTVLTVIGAGSLLEDDRFATTAARVRNMSSVYEAIAAHTPRRTTADWMAVFAREAVPAMPVRDLGDMLDDPHLRTVGFFRRREHLTEGAYFDMRPPVRFSAAPDIEFNHAPRLGEHTDEVLAALADPKNGPA